LMIRLSKSSNPPTRLCCFLIFPNFTSSCYQLHYDSRARSGQFHIARLLLLQPNKEI
jgi:hypothetical protein